MCIASLLFLILLKNIHSNNSSNLINNGFEQSSIMCPDVTQLKGTQRSVVIGDVHGSLAGLLELLYHANITQSESICEWNIQDPAGVLILQIGDIVDRGPQAFEAWRCLEHLQNSANNHNSTVVRLIGNHEVWWLTGYYHDRNYMDTKENVLGLVSKMKEEIKQKRILASYSYKVNNAEVLFVHAGVRPEFYDYLKLQISGKNGRNVSASQISEYLNGILVEDIHQCGESIECKLEHELYQAGRDRGGNSIGGPLWTDFSVLRKAAERNAMPNHFIQVVGHTIASCTRQNTACSDGLIRMASQKSMYVICIDGGMYLGARAYLEINSFGHFIAHQKDETQNWTQNDFTINTCNSLSAVNTEQDL